MVDTNASCKPSSARNGAYGRGEAKRVDGFLNGLRTKKTESSFLGGFKNGSKENRSGKLAHQVLVSHLAGQTDEEFLSGLYRVKLARDSVPDSELTPSGG